MLHANISRNRLKGIGIISIAFLCFALLDGMAKWLVRDLPVLEVVWLRFLCHVLLSAMLLGPTHGLRLVRVSHPRWQLIRGLMLAIMTGLNFWALQFLQLAETGAIQFTVPILVALISIPLLGERLDRGRWCAVIAGFVGILLILRPGTQGFHPAMFLALGNAVLYACFNLLTRRLAGSDSPEATQFLSACASVVLLAPFALAVWQTPATWSQWLLIALTGLAGGTGHYMLALAHRFAPASTLAPFLYQQIIYMVLIGYLLFGDLPSGALLLGSLVVVGSGLYLLWRETRANPPQKKAG